MALSDRAFAQALGNLGTLGSGTIYGQAGTDLGIARDRYRTLTQGSRQDILQQGFPSLNMMLDQASGARLSAGRGMGARTGGATAANAQQSDLLARNFANLIGTEQSQATDKLANIGGTELQSMQNALDTAAKVSQADIDSRRRAATAMWTSLIGGAADIATGGIAALASRGGAQSPTPSIPLPPSDAPAIQVPFPSPTQPLPPLPGQGVFDPTQGGKYPLTPGLPPYGYYGGLP